VEAAIATLARYDVAATLVGEVVGSGGDSARYLEGPLERFA
jgi:hypothetical protein